MIPGYIDKKTDRVNSLLERVYGEKWELRQRKEKMFSQESNELTSDNNGKGEDLDG